MNQQNPGSTPFCLVLPSSAPVPSTQNSRSLGTGGKRPGSSGYLGGPKLSGPRSSSAPPTGPGGTEGCSSVLGSPGPPGRGRHTRPEHVAGARRHLRGAGSRPSSGAVRAASILAPPRRHALRPSLAPYCGKAGPAVTRLPGSGEDSHPLPLRFSRRAVSWCRVCGLACVPEWW